MQMNRGLAGKPLTILIVVLAIALTIIVYFVRRNDQKKIQDRVDEKFAIGLGTYEY